MLGVIIGVSSVVLVGAAIEGMSVFAETSTARAFGGDTYVVAQIANVGGMSRRELFEKRRRNKPIRLDDLDWLRVATGDRVMYSPFRRRQDDVKHDNLTFEAAQISGVASIMPDIRDITLVEGRFFSEREEQSRSMLAVIGHDLVTNLFGAGSALGQVIKLRGIDFVVIGVQEKQGSAFGNAMDNSVYIPSSAFTRIYGPDRSLAVFGKARPDSGLTLEEALDLTRVALRSRFRTPPGQADKFDSITPDAIREFVGRILGMISAVVVPVTLMSLVVGGIVIMNIMLVSVTERTHEIGVRKAVGARRSDIRLQFLAESVMMSVVGGVIGLLLGAGGAKLLSNTFDAELPVTAVYAVLAIAVSSGVGMLSGWYPAARASKMDPVEALRAE